MLISDSASTTTSKRMPTKSWKKSALTPSELMRQTLQYGQLPFKPVLMTEDDKALIATVRERLANPPAVKVSLDDL